MSKLLDRKPAAKKVQYGFDFGYWLPRIERLADSLDQLFADAPKRLKKAVRAAVRAQINLQRNLDNVRTGTADVFSIADFMDEPNS